MEPLLAALGAVLLLFGFFGLFAGASGAMTGFHLVVGGGLLAYAGLRRSGKLVELFAGGTAKRGGNVVVQTLIVLAISGMAVFISERNPVRWDWTESGVHTLAPGTIEMLERIPEDSHVEIYAFYAKGGQQPGRAELDKYSYRSDRVKVKVFDPNERPELAHRFEVNNQDGVVIVCGGSCDEARGTARLAEVSENEITKAIRSVISETKTLYFLTGHGEADLEDDQASGISMIKTALQDENLSVEPLLLAKEAAVPEDADGVIIVGPSHSVFQRELEMLDSYLRGGGSLMIFAEPLVVSNLEEQVLSWGIELGSDILVEKQLQLFGGPKLGVQPVVNTYGAHAITEKLRGQPTVFQMARSVRASDDASGVVELAMTSGASWAETDLEEFATQRTVKLDPDKDRVGPIALAAARTFEVEGDAAAEGRLIVVGDSDFARNRYVSEFFNGDLVLNMANWLVGEEKFATIERKMPRASNIGMSVEQFANFRFLSLFFLPEAILMLGVVNWWRRRT
ncbi:MAG: GldG family protein [bacterium]|nr:GldG family protein [bacterium]